MHVKQLDGDKQVGHYEGQSLQLLVTGSPYRPFPQF